MAADPLMMVEFLLGLVFVVQMAFHVVLMRRTGDWNLFEYPTTGSGKLLFRLGMLMFFSTFALSVFNRLPLTVNGIVATILLIVEEAFTMRRKKARWQTQQAENRA